jgi:hypothetical protein
VAGGRRRPAAVLVRTRSVCGRPAPRRRHRRRRRRDGRRAGCRNGHVRRQRPDARRLAHDHDRRRVRRHAHASRGASRLEGRRRGRGRVGGRRRRERRGRACRAVRPSRCPRGERGARLRGSPLAAACTGTSGGGFAAAARTACTACPACVRDATATCRRVGTGRLCERRAGSVGRTPGSDTGTGAGACRRGVATDPRLHRRRGRRGSRDGVVLAGAGDRGIRRSRAARFAAEIRHSGNHDRRAPAAAGCPAWERDGGQSRGDGADGASAPSASGRAGIAGRRRRRRRPARSAGRRDRLREPRDRQRLARPGRSPRHQHRAARIARCVGTERWSCSGRAPVGTCRCRPRPSPRSERPSTCRGTVSRSREAGRKRRAGDAHSNRLAPGRKACRRGRAVAARPRDRRARRARCRGMRLRGPARAAP